MGQYHKLVDLTYRRYLMPHKLGAGLKAVESFTTHTYVAALIPLLASYPDVRRKGEAVADQVSGMWSSHLIAVIGDYAEDHDLPHASDKPSKIYHLCESAPKRSDYEGWADPEEMYVTAMAEWLKQTEETTPYTDFSDQAAGIVEAVLGIRFHGSGWRRYSKVQRTGDGWANTDENTALVLDRPPSTGIADLTDADVLDGKQRLIFNHDRSEFIDPTKLGITPTVAGIMRDHSICAALYALLLHPFRRGGGDMTADDYPEIGRWRGNRISVTGSMPNSSGTDLSERLVAPARRLLSI